MGHAHRLKHKDMTDKKYMLIENKGEIDVNALVLMGGSTKRDSTSAIGFFGSGNKYTIALFLKLGIGFKIYSGEQEIVIETKQVGFRDKQFQQILINGQETSLTTDMGPQWDSWMGIREWVSNSIDEGESNIVNEVLEVNPREGYTRIYVEHHPDIENVILNWDRYFSYDRIDTLIEVGEYRMYPQIDTEKESLLLYRKGIQCYTTIGSKALYNYDLPVYKINESRVVSDTYDAKTETCKFLCKNADSKVAENILANGFTSEKYWEGGMEWYYYGMNKLSQPWRDAIGDRIIVNMDASGFYLAEMAEHRYYMVSKQMARAIKESFSDVVVYGIGQDGQEGLNWREIQPSPRMQYMLKKALEACQEIQYPVNYNIKVVEFDKPDTLGCAHNSTIYIAGKTFDKGMKEVVLTIMEENEHLKTGYEDESRALQTYLFQCWLTEKEERYGVFL